MNVRQIKALIQQYGFGISPRRLGQHFLLDQRILARIAGLLAAKEGDRILEIGAGLGALTEELLATGATVYAVEKDPRFLRVLTDRFRDKPSLQLVRSDILRVDLGSYALCEPRSLLVVGNIPFSLTSPILEYLVHQRIWVRRAVLTIQKEVATRIVAKPGGRDYSSLTLLVQIAFQPSVAFTIHPGAFYPQPKVTSAVLRLDPLPAPAVPADEEEALLTFIRKLFTHRRKTVANAILTAGWEGDRQQLLELFHQGGIDPIRRPETFGLAELVELNRKLGVLRSRVNPSVTSC